MDVSKAIPIHPFDAYELYQKMSATEVLTVKTKREHGESYFEVDGVVYKQTADVPAKTKNIV